MYRLQTRVPRPRDLAITGPKFSSVCHSEKTSATWTESARGGRITVRIEKTDDAYKRKLKKYEDDQRELENLGLLLQGLSGADGPAAKRVKTEEGL